MRSVELRGTPELAFTTGNSFAHARRHDHTRPDRLRTTVTAFVLDSSIAMRWVFDGATHPKAQAILQDLASFSREAVVPLLWRYEAAAVLAVAHNRGTLPAVEITLFLTDLETLPIRVDHASSSHIFSDVYRMAVTYRPTVYDAAYLELAIRRRLSLATLDNDLIAASGLAGVMLL